MNDQTNYVKPWRDGDPRCHCTHCQCCGWLFPSVEIEQHLKEAHLGGQREELRHLREAARLLKLGVELDISDGPNEDALEQYSADVAAWLTAEDTRQVAVREL